MSTKHLPPIIGVSGCRKDIDGIDYDSAPHIFVEGLEKACGAVPLVVPTLGDALDRKSLLKHVDGLLFTGSVSNVEPHHYDGPNSKEDTIHDPYRDATTLPLIRDAVEAGIPILCVCRGFQELNVAFGGTLHQHVNEVEGMLDHRSNPDQTWEERFDFAHDVTLTEGGVFAQWAGTTEMTVNSLHGQGVDRLAERLQQEAVAPDGLIEAATVKEARRFAAGVQWHPEWRIMENPFSLKLFRAFVDSARDKAAGKF